jgi:hypothetical protein
MNLCRLMPVFALLCGLGGLLLAAVLGYPLALGGLVGLLAPTVPLTILYLAANVFFPEVPPCRCGRSCSLDSGSPDGYEFLRVEQAAFFYQCRRCGRCYAHRGDDFFLVGEDGAQQPHSRRVRGRWR